MSIQAVAWALEQDMPARPKLVLIAIANHADHTNGYCFLKAETIAGQSACTKRSVYRFIGGLIRNGYLRRETKKGDDGKQRANDYWVLFDRAENEWHWGTHVGDEDHINDSDECSDTADEATTSCDPDVQISSGESDIPLAPEDDEIHAVSSGPGDSAVTLKDSAEPSESNPKRAERSFAARPRRYQAPPPEPPKPVGATNPSGPQKPFFVYEGSKAWLAWIEWRKRKGMRPHTLPTRTQFIDGATKHGWDLPSLFPPAETEASESSEKAKERAAP